MSTSIDQEGRIRSKPKLGRWARFKRFILGGGQTVNNASIDTELPDALLWLKDAPLFIDTDQVYRFYDAVVRPSKDEGETIITFSEQKVKQISGKLGLKGSLTIGELATLLSGFLKPTVEVSGEGGVSRGTTDQESESVVLYPIKTPQRQLEQLAVHYLGERVDRIFLPTTPAEQKWRDRQVISKVPRELVFLDLPGQNEAYDRNLPETKLIPTAAEFENGKIETLFDKLKSRDRRTSPPEYPERAETPEKLREDRKKYWEWFNHNFSATQAMIVVEEAASENGRIRWIDYRVPLTEDGATLHLHLCPSGNYDTGVFAYNFIKRGYKHGLRLVGTLKSEPDMNVLAIYDK